MLLWLALLVPGDTLLSSEILTPERCRMQSIGTDGVTHPLQQCIALSTARRECGRGAHANLIEFEPSLMPACQPGARVHTRDLTNSTRAQLDIGSVVRLLPNSTVVMLGDSTMRQFFDTVVCDLLRLRLYTCVKGARLRCARTWRNVGGDALSFVRARHSDGYTWTDFSLVYMHTFPPPSGQIWTWMERGAIDVLIFNFGMHYVLAPPRRAKDKGNASAYVAHMTDMFARSAKMMRARPRALVIFQQSIAQHFGCKSSYFNAAVPGDTQSVCSGDWDSRDRTRYFLNADAPSLRQSAIRPACACYPFEPPAPGDRSVVEMGAMLQRSMGGLDLSLGWRNALAMELLQRKFRRERIGVMPWFEITRLRAQYHRMNCCTSIKSTCDCTHYCYNEVMYHEGFAELHRLVRDSLR
jgi:hypothetical protein